MPKIRGGQYVYDEIEKSTGFDQHFHNALRAQYKLEANRWSKPETLYHGSPYKLKKHEKLAPRGPTFYGFDRPGLSASKSYGDASQYAAASDAGGLNAFKDKSWGKSNKPKLFAKKGYVYHIDAKHQKGWYKQYHGGSSEPLHWASNHSQAWSKRDTVRLKGKVPVTRNEALAVAGVGAAAVGGAYYYRHRKNKLERVHKTFHETHNHIALR